MIPATDAERVAVSKLPINLDGLKADLGLGELDAPKDRSYFDRLMFHPTLTINGFHGGYGGRGSKRCFLAKPSSNAISGWSSR